MTTTTWNESSITNLINTNDKAVGRAVLAIYERQTSDEQSIGDTKYHNGIGFNGADAKYLSYCAEYMIKHHCGLTGKHLTKARQRIIKYRKQLVEIANSK